MLLTITMKRCFLFAILFAALLPAGEQSGRIAIVGVTVIDCTGAPPKPDMTLVMNGGRIEELGAASEVVVPEDAKVIPGSGRFVIPGLWDMHVHMLWPGLPQVFSRLFVANGVVAVRDMHGDPAVLNAYQKEVASGFAVPLRIAASGFAVDGPASVLPQARSVSTDTEGYQMVRTLRAEGLDFIKVYSHVPRKAYFALAAEARRLSMTFCGHVPISVSAKEASEAGQKSIEHLSGVLLACSSDEHALREEMNALQDAKTASRLSYARLLQASTHPKRLLDSYDERKARALFAQFAKKRTWQTPTLVTLRAYALGNDPALTADPRLRFIPNAVRESWHLGTEWNPESRSASDSALAMRRFRKEMDMVREMNLAGVPLLAGTDVGNPYIFPGFSLHDELMLLAEAGLTPMQALQAATRNAAEYLGRLEETGTIEKGKRADLVLLKANPLDDFRNLNAVEAVFINGRRAELGR